MIDRLAPNQRAAVRLVISLAQAGMLWALLNRPDGFSGRELATALSTFALWVPLVAIAGLGNLRPRTWVVWTVVAAVLCLGLGVHAGYRDPLVTPPHDHFFSFFSALNGCVVGLLFIGHSLVVAGDADRRWIATFATYFDVAWRHATQVALAVLFTAVFFGFLFLGAGLFDLIKLHFLRDLLRQDWFWMPAMTVAFATAIHFTDTRTAMVRGARTLVLSLLSWLMPILTLIVVGFLCALPFTGLEPLWSTRQATSILLTAAIALVLLINSHFQDGGPESRRFAVLVYTRAIAVLALLPLTGLAAIGLSLRVGQHGWTPSRIVALAFVIAVGCHAVGYFVAVIRSRTELRGLAQTNVTSALVIVALLIALLTPLGDPARLSVISQVARLERGAIAPRQFDYGFLHFYSGRYGQAALERLERKTNGANAAEIAALAADESKRPYRWNSPQTPATPVGREKAITVVHPRGATLPGSFLRTDWPRGDFGVPPCLRLEGPRCDGLIVDLDGDGSAEILLVPESTHNEVLAFKETSPGTWAPRGALLNTNCKGAIDALRRGEFQLAPPVTTDIVAGGHRLQVRSTCATP